MLRSRAGALAIWRGVALAGLFFYPLASTIHGDVYYLHWQPRHALEALAASAVLAAAGALALGAAGRLRGRAEAVATALVLLAPCASFLQELARQMPNGGAIVEAWDVAAIRLGVLAIGGVVLVVPLLIVPGHAVRFMRGALLVLSPVAIVSLGNIAASAFRAGPVIRIDTADTAAAADGSCGPVVAFVFDELSFAYVYDRGEVRADLPSIRAFASAATTYTNVSSPGSETLVSMPGYLAARRLAGAVVQHDRLLEITPSGAAVPFDARSPDALFPTAKRLGFRTEAAGYYLEYCDMLRSTVDRCESFSFYNAATVHDAFSAADPVRTTLILWPRQFPFGLVKDRPFAEQQREMVARTLAFAARPLPRAPVFRFVHFSVPHLPFVFTRDGYDPPVDPLKTTPDDAYDRQITYVDRLFGTLVDAMRRAGAFDRSTIVLLSDHGFRFGGRERNVRHIPFLVKAAMQHTAIRVDDPRQAEQILRQVVANACPARERSPQRP